MSFFYLKAWDAKESSGAVAKLAKPSEKIDTRQTLLIPSWH